MPASGQRVQPLGDAEIGALLALLDALPAPLDVSALDGFLAAVVLNQPPLAPAQWLRFVTDAEGRAPPAGLDVAALHALALRRLDELEQAVARRRWFDPWVFELEPPATPSLALVGWVAGFATALEHFPNAALANGGADTVVPLALLYRHFDAGDLEDAGGELLDEIESLEPPADLAEGVEDLVCATLLLADVSRPQPRAVRASRRTDRRSPR